jgi:hypothetical protein
VTNISRRLSKAGSVSGSDSWHGDLLALLAVTGVNVVLYRWLNGSK